MVTSLVNAESAVTALKNSGGLQPTEKNKHLFEKHYSKDQALAQGGPIMSWFEIMRTHNISQVSDADKLSSSRLLKLADVMKVKAKFVKPTLKKLDPVMGKSYAVTVTDDVGLYGIMEVIKKSLGEPYALYSNEDGGDADNSFKYLCSIPAPYVGRRIVGGQKQKLVDGLVCMVIYTGGNARVATLYPVPDTWPNNTSNAPLV